LEIFEKYLKKYHDQAIAVQTAEIYCLLKKTEKIAELRKDINLTPVPAACCAVIILMH
jgi:hypothetical protein